MRDLLSRHSSNWNALGEKSKIVLLALFLSPRIHFDASSQKQLASLAVNTLSMHHVHTLTDSSIVRLRRQATQVLWRVLPAISDEDFIDVFSGWLNVSCCFSIYPVTDSQEQLWIRASSSLLDSFDFTAAESTSLCLRLLLFLCSHPVSNSRF